MQERNSLEEHNLNSFMQKLIDFAYQLEIKLGTVNTSLKNDKKKQKKLLQCNQFLSGIKDLKEKIINQADEKTVSKENESISEEGLSELAKLMHKADVFLKYCVQPDTLIKFLNTNENANEKVFYDIWQAFEFLEKEELKKVCADINAKSFLFKNPKFFAKLINKLDAEKWEVVLSNINKKIWQGMCEKSDFTKNLDVIKNNSLAKKVENKQIQSKQASPPNKRQEKLQEKAKHRTQFSPQSNTDLSEEDAENKIKEIVFNIRDHLNTNSFAASGLRTYLVELVDTRDLQNPVITSGRVPLGVKQILDTIYQGRNKSAPEREKWSTIYSKVQAIAAQRRTVNYRSCIRRLFGLFGIKRSETTENFYSKLVGHLTPTKKSQQLPLDCKRKP